jgi:hypothetical protein
MRKASAHNSRARRVKVFQADRVTIMRHLWGVLHRIRKQPRNAVTPWGSRSAAIRCLAAKLREHAGVLNNPTD